MSTPTPIGTIPIGIYPIGGGENSGVNGLTANDIIYSAYRIAGVISEPQRGLGKSEKIDGLLMLNSMLDSWKAQRLTVYAIRRDEFDIIPSKASYTVGVGADLDIPRPERIEQAGFIYLANTPYTELPLRVLTPQLWAAISPKGMPSTIPSMVYYETQVAFGVLYLFPIPTTVNKFCLYTWQVLSEFASLTDALVVPPAYREAMEYQLAMRVADRYPTRAKMSPRAVQQAAKSLAAARTANAPELVLQCEYSAMGTGGQGRFNIITNSWNL